MSITASTSSPKIGVVVLVCRSGFAAGSETGYQSVSVGPLGFPAEKIRILRLFSGAPFICW
jgi:hypothetical protein